jgi:prepilin-type processing-associated H-X9-DG protein
MLGERPPGPRGNLGWWALSWWGSSLWAVSDVNSTRYVDIADLSPGTVCPTGYFSQGDVNSYCDIGHFWSFHSGGANWLLADGSVQFMTYDSGETVIPEMASIK